MNKDNLILLAPFCLHHGIEVSFVTTLQEYDLIEIVVVEEQYYFPVEQLAALEKIIRLHYELDINLEGIDVILHLLNQIETYQSELRAAQNKLGFFEK